ncbi:AAA family ATPase [Dehalococcoides mccartyi]|uniref:AAA family ATPase n=1 Tax=Dehalococcoides mccartyi TaxID=61435 RepID=UPI0003C88D03|nr:AAA family ATPase [Dehalococcoides mccartyi]AHB12901.1 AAA-domain-containing protein [Dehalococcoides mccartyi GY50]
MIIESLLVEKLYGHIDIKMNFYSDLNFLIGINGTGKTSVLNLIYWTLTPSLKKLAQLSFRKIEIAYKKSVSDKISNLITVTKNQDTFILQISGISNKLTVPILNAFTDYSNLENRDRQLSLFELYDRFTSEKQDHPVMKALANISSPLYVPLDRRWDDDKKETTLSLRQPSRYLRNVKYPVQAKFNQIFYPAEKHYREKQFELAKYNEELRVQIVESTFDIEILPKTIVKPWNVNEVKAKKKKIFTGLKQCGIDIHSEVLEGYFNKLEVLAESLKDKKIDYEKPEKDFVEWLLFIPKINWIETIIKITEEHNKKRENILKTLDSFLTNINSFFNDSNKQVQFNTSGEIEVIVNNSEIIKSDALSSGETQLLVLFTYLYFVCPTKESVVMIDEPELSLHPKWQKEFITAITKANPDVQFILATHSPEIVLNRDNKCIEIAGT